MLDEREDLTAARPVTPPAPLVIATPVPVPARSRPLKSDAFVGGDEPSGEGLTGELPERLCESVFDIAADEALVLTESDEGLPWVAVAAAAAESAGLGFFSEAVVVVPWLPAAEAEVVVLRAPEAAAAERFGDTERGRAGLRPIESAAAMAVCFRGR